MDIYHPLKKAISWGIVGGIVGWLCGLSILICFVGMGTGGLMAGLADQFEADKPK